MTVASVKVDATAHPSTEIKQLSLQLQKLPSANLYAQRGKAFLQHKKPTQALNDFRQALEINPNHFVARFYMAKLYFSVNRIGQARIAVQQYLECDNLSAIHMSKGLELLGDLYAYDGIKLAATTYWQAFYLLRTPHKSLTNKLLQETSKLDSSFHEFARQVAANVFHRCEPNSYSKFDLFILLGKFGLSKLAQHTLSELAKHCDRIERETLMAVFYISAKQPEIALTIIHRLEKNATISHAATLTTLKQRALITINKAANKK